MIKNFKYQAMVLGCMLVSGSVMAQVSFWTGGVGDWEVAGNWDALAVPTSSDETHINTGGGEVATVNTNGAQSARLVMENTAHLIIANGAQLTVAGQALLGNAGSSVDNTITVDGGTFNQGTPGGGTSEFFLGANAGEGIMVVTNSGTANVHNFALGVNGGNGLLTIDSGTVNVSGTGTWLIPGYIAGSTGNVVVDGGALNLVGAVPLHLGYFGHGTLTVNDGTVTLDNALNVAVSPGSQGDLVMNGGTVTAVAVLFDFPGTQTLDLNGGQLITTGGFSEGANSTFYIGYGELILNGGQTLTDVQNMVTNSNWIFDDIPYVYDSGSGIVVTSIDGTSLPFPALAEDVMGPELIPNGDFASMTNNVDNPSVSSDLWYVTDSYGDLWEAYEGYADLVDWSFYYADPTNITPLVGIPGTQDLDTDTYPLDATIMLDTWINGDYVILSSVHSYRNGMKSEDILNGAVINPAGTYNFEISGYAQVDSVNATVTAALTAGTDATNTANAIGSLIEAPIADLSDTLTVQLSGADLTNGQVNVMFHVENTDVLPGVAEGSNALIRANYRSTPPNSQAWFSSISLHETSVPEEGDMNRDGALNFFDLELGNAYLDGSIDGGDDAAARQAYWIGEGMTAAEALAHLNLTEFDLNGDDTFDAADIAILETLTAQVITSVVINGSGHVVVEAAGLGAGIDYYLMRTTDLLTPFDTQADSITAAGETGTLTDTAPPAGEAFYSVVR